MATTMQMSLRSSTLAQPLGRKPISSVFRSSAQPTIARGRQMMAVRAGEKESLDSDSYQKCDLSRSSPQSYVTVFSIDRWPVHLLCGCQCAPHLAGACQIPLLGNTPVCNPSAAIHFLSAFPAHSAQHTLLYSPSALDQPAADRGK